MANDGFYYHVVANELASGHFFVYGNPTPSAFHPPAWATVLSLPSLVSLTTVLEHQFASCAVGAVTIALVGLTGRAIAGPRVGLIAAAIGALYPNFWIWERELASETLLLPLVAGTLLLAYRFRARPRLSTMIALGAVCALLTLTRAEQVLLFAFLLVPLALRFGLPLGRAAKWLAAAAITAAFISAPWIVYNASRFEHPVVLTTGLGPNLGLGNDNVTYRGPLVGGVDATYWPQFFRQTGDESVKDVRARRQALAYMRSHLASVPIVITARQGRTWDLFNAGQQASLDRSWGHDPLWVYRAGVLTYWVLLASAIVGIVVLRLRRIYMLPLLAPFLVVAVTTALTFGEPRYRAAAEVPLVLLAAIGIEALFARSSTRARKQRTAPLDKAG